MVSEKDNHIQVLTEKDYRKLIRTRKKLVKKIPSLAKQCADFERQLDTEMD